MINFVLNAHGQQTLRFKCEDLPITTRCPHPDLLGALDLLIDARHGKTPFLAELRSSALDNLRIDKDLQPACVEACSAGNHGAMLFGDLNDTNSEIAKRIATYATTQVRADLALNTGVRYEGI